MNKSKKIARGERGTGSLERMVSPLSSSAGRLEQAKRFALMNYDHWNEVTGFPTPHTSYYYEIASIIEDAVEFGFGVAHGQTWKTIVRRLKRANDQAHRPALKGNNQYAKEKPC